MNPPPGHPRGLSKSRLIAWRQCPRRLWLELNRPDLRLDDPAARQRFAVGHRVGEIARDLEPGGVLIGAEDDLAAALETTARALDLLPGKPLFEPAFRHDGLLVRIDRLYDLLPLTRAYYYHPAMKGSWSIKAVLPTVAPDLDYAALGEVRDGIAAQAAHAEILDPATPEDLRQTLATGLRDYCRLDTLAMVRLAELLAEGPTRHAATPRNPNRPGSRLPPFQGETHEPRSARSHRPHRKCRRARPGSCPRRRLPPRTHPGRSGDHRRPGFLS